MKHIWVVIVLAYNGRVGWVYTFSTQEEAEKYNSSLVGYESQLVRTKLDEMVI